MNFADRVRLLPAPSKKANPRDSWPDWTDEPVTLGPIVPVVEDLAPRWRSLATTIRTEELERLDGYGLEILEELVRLAHDTHRAELDQAVAAGEDPAEFAAASGDLVIWDANRIVAILRALPDGSLEDNRFSRTGFLTDPCERAGIPGKGGAL